MTGYVNCPFCGDMVEVEYEEHKPSEDIEDSCGHCGTDFKYQWEADVNIWAVNNGN